MHRRSFIRSASLAVSAGLAASACGDSGIAVGDLPSIDAQTLAVQPASLEFLTGPDRWIAFGVTMIDRAPLEADRAVQIYLRTLTGNPDDQGEVVAGPFDATYSPAADTGQSIYYLQADLEMEGLFEIVAISGEDFGTAAVQVVDPANSRVMNPADSSPVIPGSMAIAAPTPTTQDDLGVFSICTQDPVCGMHEISLDDALATGQPVVLMFATPQYCQTAVCGPSVVTLDSIRQDIAADDVIFIHSEIFAEEPTGANVAATPVTEAVSAWGLPTEPWLFTIGADGVILDRLDGPMPEPVVRNLVEALTA